MKTITIRDLRQRWPEAEKSLQVENEILITRDSRPVARLVRYVEERRQRQRFDPDAHSRLQRQINGPAVTRWVEEALLQERNER